MANPAVGKMRCPMPDCEQQAEVRKDRNHRLYLACPDCGHIAPKLAGGQDKILKHARMGADDPVPDLPPAVDPAPPAPEPAKPPVVTLPPRKRSALDDWMMGGASA